MGTIQETKPDPASGLSLFLIMQHEQQTALRNLISVTTTLMTASVHTITPPWYLVLLLLVLLACKLGLLLGRLGCSSGSSTEAFPSPFSFFVMRFSLLFVGACALRHGRPGMCQRCMQ